MKTLRAAPSASTLCEIRQIRSLMDRRTEGQTRLSLPVGSGEKHGSKEVIHLSSTGPKSRILTDTRPVESSKKMLKTVQNIRIWIHRRCLRTPTTPSTLWPGSHKRGKTNFTSRIHGLLAQSVKRILRRQPIPSLKVYNFTLDNLLHSNSSNLRFHCEAP